MAGVKPQWVKHPLCKLEDQDSEPWNLCQKWADKVAACNPITLEA